MKPEQRPFAPHHHANDPFCEAASGAGIAGLRAAIAAGHVSPQAPCVAVLTGHGLKDPEPVVGALARITELPADVGDVARTLGL